MDEPLQPYGRTRPTWPVVSLVTLYLAAALPLIVSGTNVGRYAWDQVNYHEKVVRTFISQWPAPDLADYLSATTPLYHLVLAAAGRSVSDSSIVLQLVGSSFTLGLLVTLALALFRTTTASRVFVFTLVLAASLYVFPAGVWMLPDNLAWWGVLGVLLIAWRCRFDATLVVGGGAIMAALVLTRQSHLWAAAALWASAWMSLDTKRQPHPHQRWRSPLGKFSTNAKSPAREVDVEGPLPRGTLRRILSNPWRRSARTLVVVLATLPAFGIVLWFRNLWGGRLYPPAFDIQLNYPPNPATPIFIMAVFGVFNVFFVAYLFPRLAVLWRHARWMALLLLIGSLVIACLPHTSHSVAEGRFGALWSIAGKFQTIQHRSPMIVALAVWGAFALVGWCAALSRGPRIVVLVSLAGFIAAQSAGHLVFQRYCEPMLLMLTVLLAARTPEWPGPKWLHRFKLVGPAALALGLATYTGIDLARSDRVQDEGTALGSVPGLPEHEPPPPRK